MNVISEVRKRVLNKEGKFLPGSIARLSQYLGCTRNTVKNCVRGYDENGVEWSFSDARVEKLRNVITLDLPLGRMKPGPKTPRIQK